MNIPKFIKRLYMKPLTPYEQRWLYNTMVSKPEYRTSMSFPPMTMKQYRKLLERDDLYKV